MKDQDIPWRDLIAVLYRRRRFIARLSVLGTAAVALGLFLVGPRYQATATLRVTAQRPPAISAQPGSGSEPAQVSDEELNSEATLLQSDDLVREVLESFKDAHTQPPEGLLKTVLAVPVELLGSAYRALHGVPAQSSLDRWVEHTRKHLEVELVKKSSLIAVSYGDRAVDPEWTAELVNALVDRHLQHQDRWSRQSEAQRFFQSQLDLLREKARLADESLHAFYRREGLDSLPEQEVTWRQRLVLLTNALADGEAELATAHARTEFLEKEITKHPQTVTEESRLAQNQAVQFIKPRILEKEMQRNELLSVYAPSSTKVRAVERELAEARRLLKAEQATIAESTNAVNPVYRTLEIDLAQSRASEAAVEGKVEALRKQLADCRAKIEHLDRISPDYDRLQQEVTTTQEALQTYARKAEQARLGNALDESRIVSLAVAEPARVPSEPAGAHTAVLLLLGAMMSLFGAIAVAFVRDYTDPAIKSSADAGGATGLPVFARASA